MDSTGIHPQSRAAVSARLIWPAIVTLPDGWHELRTVAPMAGVDYESNRPGLGAGLLADLGLLELSSPDDGPLRLRPSLTYELALDWIGFWNRYSIGARGAIVARSWLYGDEARAAVFDGLDRDNDFWQLASERLQDWAVQAQLLNT
jgi:hypothetical protein